MLAVGAVIAFGWGVGSAQAQCEDVTNEFQKLTPPIEEGDWSNFGRLLAADGDSLAVAEDSAVYVYRRQADGKWWLERRIENTGNSQSGIAESIAMSDGILAIGTPYFDIGQGNYQGKIDLYERSSDGHWTLVSTLPNPSESSPDRRFGECIAMDDGILAVMSTNGSTLRVRIYEASEHDWGSAGKIDVQYGQSEVGLGPLAVEDKSVFVGIYQATVDNLERAGEVQVLRKGSNGVWEIANTMHEPTIRNEGEYGEQIHHAPGSVIVHAQFNTYIYSLDGDLPILEDTLDEPDSGIGPFWGDLGIGNGFGEGLNRGLAGDPCGLYRHDAIDGWRFSGYLFGSDTDRSDGLGDGYELLPPLAAGDGFVAAGAPNAWLVGAVANSRGKGAVYLFDGTVPVGMTLATPRKDPYRYWHMRTFCATAGAQVFFFGAQRQGEAAIPQCPGTTLSLHRPILMGHERADQNGQARITFRFSMDMTGDLLFFQAVEVLGCRVSNVRPYLLN